MPTRASWGAIGRSTRSWRTTWRGDGRRRGGPGELAALRGGRLDLLRGTCEVVESATEVDNKLVWGVTKTYERRSVRLPRSLCEQVSAYLADRPHAPDDLVLTRLQGGPLRPPRSGGAGPPGRPPGPGARAGWSVPSVYRRVGGCPRAEQRASSLTRPLLVEVGRLALPYGLRLGSRA